MSKHENTLQEKNERHSKTLSEILALADEIDRKTHGGWQSVFGMMFFIAPLTYIFFYFCEVSSLLWRPLSVLLYILLALFTLVFVIISTETAGNKDGVEKRDFESDLALAIVSTAIIVVCVSQISRHMYIMFGGFTANQDGYWHWVRFGLAHTLDGVLLGIPSVYGWRITEIRPVALWSQTFFIIFHILLALFSVNRTISFIQTAYRNFQKPKVKYSDIGAESYFWFIIIRLTQSLILAPIVIGLFAIIVDVPPREISWTVIKYGVLVGLGGLLVLLSSWAIIKIPGKKNKLSAILGIVTGIILLTLNF